MWKLGRIGWVASLVLVLALPALAAEPIDKAELAKRLAALDTNVISAEERAAAVERYKRHFGERIKEANQKSSHDWEAMRSDRTALDTWLAKSRKALRESLGTFQTPDERLEFHVTKTIKGEGFTIDNVLFTSGRGLWIAANLYRPDPTTDSMPGILICHSHHTPKTQGELQDMGMTWARTGCLVLVMDQLGHGERRQHPFKTDKDYSKEYKPSRQDYYFRYDNAIELDLVGESLIGWMAWDLMRGVDLLLEQKGMDPKRVALLGSVAGGGDPAAVAGALDERISVVCPFNFGGPQPETKYPLPDNAETWFNYAGGGGWESTRNLRYSLDDRHYAVRPYTTEPETRERGTFLPWQIVGGIAPRKLIYGHEFSWDRPRDPVWKRLETIYALHNAQDNLSFTTGSGSLRGSSPTDSHCTHIGPLHRKGIHEALSHWWGLPNGVEREYSKRVPSEELMAFTPKWLESHSSPSLSTRLGQIADQRLLEARNDQLAMARRERPMSRSVSHSLWLERVETPKAAQEMWPRTDTFLRPLLTELLGRPWPTAVPKLLAEAKSEAGPGCTIERLALQVDADLVIAIMLLIPTRVTESKDMPPVIVSVSQADKDSFLRRRADEIATLLAGGAAVCLLDVRGTGETKPGNGRDRTSDATAYSSSEQMLGSTMAGVRLRDLRSVLHYLRNRTDLDGKRIGLWGESFAEPNPAETNFAVPHGIDGRPRQSEPLGGLLAVLAGLYERDVRAVYVSGGLSAYRSVLDSPFVYIPHDAVIPGILAVGDLPDITAELAPRPVRLDNLVDGLNRRVAAETIRKVYQPAIDRYEAVKAPERLSLGDDKTTAAEWLLKQLREP